MITRTDHDRPCARCASHALPHHHSPINSPPSSSTPVLAEPDERTTAGNGRSNVIKTSRSHRCHARWRSSSGSTVFRSAFSRANSFVSPRGRDDRYSMGSTEDLGGSTPSRYGSIVIEARGSARGSSSAIVVLLDSQIFVRGKKKTSRVNNVLVAVTYLACRMNFWQEEESVEPFLWKFARGIVTIN